ncbi:MAG: hypothetical protein JSR46_03330 [Verrucomicrobia bacterium]|nr:hypothetical protein [Verrucomicrobiota bacterium]
MHNISNDLFYGGPTRTTSCQEASQESIWQGRKWKVGHETKKVFRPMGQLRPQAAKGWSNPQLVQHNIRIKEAAKRGDVRKCWEILDELPRRNLHPDAFSFTPILNMYVRQLNEAGAYSVLEEMERANVRPNVMTFNALINLFARKGDVRGAYDMLEEMKKANMLPDTVTFNSLINLFVKMGDVDAAYACFEGMKRANVLPDRVTFNSLLNFFVKKEDVRGAYACFEDMKKANVLPNMVTFTSLIHLFVKIGDVDAAYACFDGMKRANVLPDTVTFNSLLNLFVRQGDVRGAYDVLEEMRRANVLPDEMIINSLIDLLVNVGRMTQAKLLFTSYLNVKEDNGTLNFHGFTHGAAYISFVLYLESSNNNRDEITLITGKGNHNRNESYAMRDFIRDKIRQYHKDLNCEVYRSNKGRLKVTQN